MARTELTVQAIVRAGDEPTYEAANSDGEEFDNTGKQFLHIKNGSGGSITITIVTPGTVDEGDLAVADRTIAIPAGKERMIGPFPPATYNQSDETVDVNFSGVTSLTIGAFSLL